MTSSRARTKPRATFGDASDVGAQPPHVLSDGALTIAAACKLVSLGRTTLYQAMRAGELPYYHIGRSVRIARRALFAWLATKQRGGWAASPHTLCGAIPQPPMTSGLMESCCSSVATPNGNGALDQ